MDGRVAELDGASSRDHFVLAFSKPSDGVFFKPQSGPLVWQTLAEIITKHKVEGVHQHAKLTPGVPPPTLVPKKTIGFLPVEGDLFPAAYQA
eukprot:13145577-Alexandrium_andersonii.AAC.1